MARRSITPILRNATLSPGEIDLGIDRLKKRIDEIRAFDPLTVVDQFNIPELNRLHDSIDDSLMRTFGADTHEYERYKDAAEFDNGPFNYAYQVDIGEVRASLTRSKARNIAVLEGVIEGLEERIAEADLVEGANSPVSKRPSSRKVFIVHGREDGPREAVARFLEKLGFQPIILHEQANQGRTVIEKVEHHGDVGFAVVILTPDDVGALKDEPLQPRARQNVLLELGYFIGKLTRTRVCSLRVGDLEIPSDWRGVVDEPFDANGGWRQALARELEAAGYHVDWNKVMRA